MHIFLHVCCGPCSIAPVLRLKEQGHTVTGFFVNPNIHPLSEYLKRRDAMVQCAEQLNLKMLWNDEVWNVQTWTHIAANLQAQGQNRCSYCYESRFDICAQAAKAQGADVFSSSLLYSRYQNHQLIIDKAKEASIKHKINFYYDDFRQDWQKGIDISREFNLYRQNYCGCIYSEAERHAKKLNRLIK